eukprot:25441_1
MPSSFYSWRLLIIVTYFLYAINANSANLSLSSIVDALDAESQIYWSKNNYIKMMKNFTDPMLIENRECDEIERSFKLFIDGFIFAMYFQDLCNIIFHYDNIDHESSGIMSEMKNVINYHVEEDGTHLPMYFHDRKKLELDANPIGYSGGQTEYVSFLFGPHAELHRIAGYDVVRIDAKYNGDKNPLVRYIIIEIIEIGGKLLFDPQCRLYETYHCKCQNPLVLQYLGTMHCALEPGDIIVEHHNIFDDYFIDDEKTIQLLFQVGREMTKVLNDIYQNFYNFFASNRN